MDYIVIIAIIASGSSFMMCKSVKIALATVSSTSFFIDGLILATLLTAFFDMVNGK